MQEPTTEKGEHMELRPIKNGWAALGDGWAVHGETKEEAERLFRERVEFHKELDARRELAKRR